MQLAVTHAVVVSMPDSLGARKWSLVGGEVLVLCDRRNGIPLRTQAGRELRARHAVSASCMRTFDAEFPAHLTSL